VNGLFHWEGKSWVLVNPAFCTYAYDNEHGQMLHGTGKGWEAVPNPDPCNYVKAHNGMFHYKGKKQGWVLERIKKCKYLYSNMQKTMWHSTKTDWEEVKGEDGKVVSARNGTYRYDKDKGWVKQR